MNGDRKAMGREVLNYSFADPLGAPGHEGGLSCFLQRFIPLFRIFASADQDIGKKREPETLPDSFLPKN
ncbi:hypothetical protein D9M70_428080 [compost metagenome]